MQRGESIEETRCIRAQQDREYEESLRIDREKEAQARRDRQRAEVICLFIGILCCSPVSFCDLALPVLHLQATVLCLFRSLENTTSQSAIDGRVCSIGCKGWETAGFPAT